MRMPLRDPIPPYVALLLTIVAIGLFWSAYSDYKFGESFSLFPVRRELSPWAFKLYLAWILIGGVACVSLAVGILINR